MTDIFGVEPDPDLSTPGLGNYSTDPFNQPSMTRSTPLIDQYLKQQQVDNDAYVQRVQNAQSKIDEYNQALEIYARDHKPGKILGFLPDWIEMPLEKLGSGLYWTYSKFVSQPLSFSMLYTRELDDWLFHGDDPMSVRDTWNQARHFSPGQSFISMFLSDEYLEGKGIDMEDVNAGLNSEKMFGSGWAMYASGAIDVGVSFFADPTVLALRGVSLGRKLTFVKPTSKITDYVANNDIAAMANLIDTMRAKSPNTFEHDLANNFISIKRSAKGDALIEALSRSKAGEETVNVLRAAAGDGSVIGRVAQDNALAAAALRSSNQRLSLIGSEVGISANPMTQVAYANALSYHQKVLNQVERQSQVLQNIGIAQDSLYALNFNRFTTPMGVQYRSWVDKLPRYRGDGSTPITTGNMFARVARFSFYTAPVRIFQLPFRAGRAWHDIAPPRYIDIQQADSWRRVDAVLRDVRSLEKGEKDELVSRYLRAQPEQRANVLRTIEAKTVEAMAARHGMDSDSARALYSTYNTTRQRMVTNRTYGNAMIEDPLNPGATIRIDSYSGSDGHLSIIAPHLSSQLENTHVLMDFAAMESVIRNSGSAIGRAINGSKKITGATTEVLDVINKYWKVSNLISIRYGIRAVSDDLLGQVARYGAFAMGARAVEGSRNLANKYSRATWRKSAQDSDNIQMHLASRDLQGLRQGLGYAMARYERYPTANNATIVARYEDEILDAENGVAMLERRMGVRAADRPMIYSVNGRMTPFPAASDGTSGAMFMREVANVRSHDELLGVTAGRLHRVVPSGNFTTLRALEDEVGHKDAWRRVITRQFANDPAIMHLLQGGNEATLLRWLRTDPIGQRHWNTMRSNYGAINMSQRDFVTRVAADLDDVLPMTLPRREQLVENMLDGKRVGEFLDDIPVYMRPDIRSELMDNPAGINALTRHIDDAIENFYRFFNQIPAERLSRSPLFASLYRTHVGELVENYAKQGVTHMGKVERERIALVARQRSLSDVKQFSFNLDHEARLAHAFRFASPFIASFMESANRWFRIIRDKPQTVAHAANLYNSPTRAGWTTDQEGNKISPDGTVTDPVTGEKRLIPLSERSMTVQIPDWAQPLMEKMVGSALPEMSVPMNSIIPTVQNTPIWNPGFGPFVQIPLSKFIDASPSTEEMFREMGLLPFQNRSAFQGAGWIGEAYRAVTGDKLPVAKTDGYDQDVLAVLRKMGYDYEEGRRSDPPSIEEARSYARKMSGLKALQKFLLPFGGTLQRGIKGRPEGAEGDVEYKPIKFFVDRYQDMISADPVNGLDNFLDKFGDSYFAFTVSLTKANSTVPSTTGALGAMQEYENLLKEVDPDLGGLIVGVEGKGPFSSTAYYYQLETGTNTGEKMRERLSPEEFVKELDRRRGWYDYNKAMLQVQADLFDAGFQSFEDRGAESIADIKRRIVDLLTSPTNLDGSKNEMYNKAWEEDYNTQDRGFYDRRAAEMQKVVDYFELKDAIEGTDSNQNSVVWRGDIYGLRQYLANRRQVDRVLAERNAVGGSLDINAKGNADVKDAFIMATVDLMERYTPFAELHNRYLSRDMGIDVFSYAGREPE